MGRRNIPKQQSGVLSEEDNELIEQIWKERMSYVEETYRTGVIPVALRLLASPEEILGTPGHELQIVFEPTGDQGDTIIFHDCIAGETFEIGDFMALVGVCDGDVSSHLIACVLLSSAGVKSLTQWYVSRDPAAACLREDIANLATKLGSGKDYRRAVLPD